MRFILGGKSMTDNDCEIGVKLCDVIGIILLVSDLNGKNRHWVLKQGKVKSIIVNSKGRRVKADHFYTLDSNEVEDNTEWMLVCKNVILTGEPFILTDELRTRVEKWIARKNAIEQEAQECSGI